MDLFKGKLDISKVFETIATGTDKLFFTQEEKSELNVMLADKVAEYAKNTLSENTVRSRTRRYISIAIITVFLLLTITYTIASMLGMETDIIKDLLFDSPLSTSFIMVLAFFFGGYYLKGMKLPTIKKEK